MTNKFYSYDLTKSEEDYLKALFQIIIESEVTKVGNNQLAEYLKVSPASANNMIKKLKGKKLVISEKYGKLELTSEGKEIAVWLVRKHRLWETFLYKYMNFSWDEVHEVAEQLEHIRSAKLIDELDRFMDYPQKDPHGDIIPDEKGNYELTPKITLSHLKGGERCRLVAVNDSSVAFLKYVSEIGLALSSEIKVEEVVEFDRSVRISFSDRTETVSRKFADNIFVELL
ncbi:metal-dependent transcriptional regulator [Leptobacterium flavescens]|uniref:Transcriptional regulator MntR n=1 Tax=Leptobacterium flavescens TaxID=472055 RepID=A0A6P0UMH1_9FLAO|nr:metal-dependent transcriptional regulator [Leptobacterium flavescens]NER13068.1 metal-dependent transcriptional regulator [Leptobacterium flavescens]